MDRQFLVAVSEDKSALHGIRFLNSFFSDKDRIKPTFFYSSPIPPGVKGSSPGLEAKAHHKMEGKHVLASGRKALKNAVDKSLSLGFPKDNLSQKLHPSSFSTVFDIIEEGESGGYDAVVLGRRNLGMLEAALDSSISKTLFNTHFDFPLWLCRSIEPGRTNVLLYADGSPMSLRMAAHVAKILGTERRHAVDILMEKEGMENRSLRQEYGAVFKGHGIDQGRMGWIEAPKFHLAGHILKLVSENGYAAVALGRSSEQPNMFTRLFKGPVASVLFRELSHAALWVSY